MMKKAITFFLLAGLLYLGTQSLMPQEKKKAAKKEEKKVVEKEIPLKLPEKPRPPYNPEGRRDPFRDLLAGREVVETEAAEGLPQMSIDNINLIGIVKIEGKYIAIINSSKGFPFNIRVNDRLADGFVLSIEENRVVFRKTKERGIALIKPENIVKEIKIEER